MKTLWICCCVAPLLLLSACGSRRQAQPVAQQYSEPVPQHLGEPVTPEAAQPLPQPAGPPVSQQPVQQPAGPAAQLAAPQEPPEKPSPTGSQRGYQGQERYEQPSAPAPEQPAAIAIPAGTLFEVRLDETLDTKRNRAGDRFSATLRDPIVVDGQTILARGTRCEGHLVEAKPSGRLKGRAVLAVRLDAFNLNGRTYEIRTTAVDRESGRHRKRNWLIIGGGSGLGTALGAIAGGPAGALIGAGAGGAAGLAGAAITGKKNVRLPAETVLTFRLRNSVEL